MPTRILVVDDEAPVCESVTQMLTQNGCIAVGASNAKDALAKMEEQSFDLVVTDYLMRGMNGQPTRHTPQGISSEPSDHSINRLFPFATRRGNRLYCAEAVLPRQTLDRHRRGAPARIDQLRNRHGRCEHEPRFRLNPFPVQWQNRECSNP